MTWKGKWTESLSVKTTRLGDDLVATKDEKVVGLDQMMSGLYPDLKEIGCRMVSTQWHRFGCFTERIACRARFYPRYWHKGTYACSQTHQVHA